MTVDVGALSQAEINQALLNGAEIAEHESCRLIVLLFVLRGIGVSFVHRWVFRLAPFHQLNHIAV